MVTVKALKPLYYMGNKLATGDLFELIPEDGVLWGRDAIEVVEIGEDEEPPEISRQKRREIPMDEQRQKALARAKLLQEANTRRKAEKAAESEQVEKAPAGPAPTPRRRRGRPPGSRNKKKMAPPNTMRGLMDRDVAEREKIAERKGVEVGELP